MKKMFIILCSFALSFTNARLEAEPTAQEIISLAIKAQCDKPERFAQYRNQIQTLKGVIYSQMKELPTDRTLTASWPDRMRLDTTMEFPEGKKSNVIVLKDDQGWTSSPSMVPEALTFNQMDEVLGEAHGRYVATLIPLSEEGFTLTKMKDALIENEDAWVVKVTKKFKPDVLLSINKKTHFLMRASYKSTVEGTPVRKEMRFSAYKDYNGIQFASKVIDLQNGNKAASYTLVKIEALPKLPEELFAKPNDKK